MCVSQGERRCFGAKKRPSFIFALSLWTKTTTTKTHRQLDVCYPAKLLQRHDHLCKARNGRFTRKKKVSEREREKCTHRRRGEIATRERERERKERETPTNWNKKGRREIGSIFTRNVLSQRRVRVYRNTLEIKRRREE